MNRNTITFLTNDKMLLFIISVIFLSFTLPNISSPGLNGDEAIVGKPDKKELFRLRGSAIWAFYLSPSYIIKRLLMVNSHVELIALIKGGLSLLKRGIFLDVYTILKK